MEKIEFEFRLTLKEYRNGVSHMTNAQWVTRLVYYLGAICILYFILSLIPSNEIETQWNILFIGVMLLGLIPYSIYRSVAKRYNSMPRIRELVKYSISESEIQVLGESYSTTLKTQDLLKMKEIKLVLLIYENKMQAHILPKRVLNDSDMDKIKGMLKR